MSTNYGFISPEKRAKNEALARMRETEYAEMKGVIDAGERIKRNAADWAIILGPERRADAPRPIEAPVVYTWPCEERDGRESIKRLP